jgi:hypothetical protein
MMPQVQFPALHKEKTATLMAKSLIRMDHEVEIVKTEAELVRS